QIAFSARQAGTYYANLVVSDSAGTQYLPVQATTLMAMAGVNPASTDVGLVSGGRTTLTTITVDSQGNLPLVITGDRLDASSSFYSIRSDNCVGATLAPGASCTIVLGFTPLDPGLFTAMLTVFDNNVGPASQTATISGLGS